MSWYNNNIWVDSMGFPVEFAKRGSTDQRPEMLSNLYIGYTYFDTTLNKPVYWNGTSWIDPTENISWATIE